MSKELHEAGAMDLMKNVTLELHLFQGSEKPHILRQGLLKTENLFNQLLSVSFWSTWIECMHST